MLNLSRWKQYFMKTDSYTKIILTIISCALVILVCQNAFEIEGVNAADGVSKVALCDTSGEYCAEVLPTENGFGAQGIRVKVMNLNEN
jgi:hypothetical protein